MKIYYYIKGDYMYDEILSYALGLLEKHTIRCLVLTLVPERLTNY